MKIDSLLSDENWIRAYGVEKDSGAAKSIRGHLLEAHAEIKRLRSVLMSIGYVGPAYPPPIVDGQSTNSK